MKILGIPLKIGWSMIPAAALFIPSLYEVFPTYNTVEASLLATISFVAIYVSILIHELGHSLQARRIGIDTERITIMILGGLAFIEEEPDHPKDNLTIAAVGPTANFVLAAAAIAVMVASQFFHIGWMKEFAATVAAVNIVIAGFNILPIYPLDGGRVLQSVIWFVNKSKQKSKKLVARLGIAAALIGLVWAIMHSQWWLAIIAIAIVVLNRIEIHNTNKERTYP